MSCCCFRHPTSSLRIRDPRRGGVSGSVPRGIRRGFSTCSSSSALRTYAVPPAEAVVPFGRRRGVVSEALESAFMSLKRCKGAWSVLTRGRAYHCLLSCLSSRGSGGAPFTHRSRNNGWSSPRDIWADVARSETRRGRRKAYWTTGAPEPEKSYFTDPINTVCSRANSRRGDGDDVRGEGRLRVG
jgi:hypothetical protein